MNSFIVQSLDDEYDVISAFDGQQGIEKALAYRPTLIVSDIMMPNISGEQMINELRRDPEMDETPILLLSAKADDELKNKLLAKQAQDYITKPFSERELQVRIRNLVAVRHSQEAIREAEKGKHVEMELANRDLQIRLKQLSELFEQTPSFMVVLRGPKHVFEFANSAFYNLVGNRELIGRSALEAFPEIAGQGFFELLDQVLASGQPFQGKELPVLLQREQGVQLEQRYVDFVFQPMIENDLIAGIFIEGHDVTEQVNAKRQLLENEERLEQLVNERTGALKHLNQSLKLSNEDLQQFAHVASHDLKEPIRKIKTYSKRLQDDYKQLLPEQGNNFLDKILSATDRIYSMIDGVLSYSKMTSDEHPEEIVDLNKVLKHIETDLEVLIEEKKAIIEVARLPQVKGASILFYQLFYNLVNNSIKFSKANEPPRITIKSSKEQHEGNPFVRIVVKDNGIGFDPENSEKIFKTFTRLNSKDRYEGTGLGLALCKKIVQRHGGFISAKGQKNAGAEFTVLLPLD